jgi:hypothetical protein
MNNDKRKFNICGRCYVKENAAGGEILSFIPEVPTMKMYLDDLVFILTIPNNEQKFAPAYCRLQSKLSNDDINTTVEDFTEIRSVVFLRQKKGELLVCAPKDHVLVDLSKLVIIATVPAENKTSAPCYIRQKTYEKTKNELKAVELGSIGDMKEVADEDNDVSMIKSEIYYPSAASLF